jgi:selenocysteine lyase/cysteine desulfurase
VDLDIDFVRRQFPAFGQPALAGWSFFENAGGSYACRQTIDALSAYYTATKVQPYGPYPASQEAGAAIDRSHQRWADALGVAADEVHFGPSTSMNCYVLAQAFAGVLGPGDEVVVTNQDHEANTGAVRRMAERVGATLVEWRMDPATGLLGLDELADLLGPATRLVTVPHCSNIVGQENDVAAIADLAHQSGARLVVDGVSYAPHSFPDVAALGADVYLFSLYKTYSVHQGLMVVRDGLLDELPNQGHAFNHHLSSKRLTPAGPDHGQEAAASAVLDYVEALHRHHTDQPPPATSQREAPTGGPGDKAATPTGSGPGDKAATPAGSGEGLGAITRAVSARWRQREASLLPAVLDRLAAHPAVRLLGPGATGTGGLHRCPTVAFVPTDRHPEQIADELSRRRIMCSAGHFYAYRVLQGLGIDPERGVVRLSWVHYTSDGEMANLMTALDDVLGAGADLSPAAPR